MTSKSSKWHLNGVVRRSVYLGLFWCFTLSVWLLSVLEFLTHANVVLPYPLYLLYSGWVPIFTLEKEASRWKTGVEYKRPGELWVVVWCTTYAIIGIIVGIFPDLTTIHQLQLPETLAHPNGFHLPENLTKIVAIVLGVFIPSELSKKLWQTRRGTPSKS